MNHVKAVWHRNQAAIWLARQRADSAFDIGIVVNLDHNRLDSKRRSGFLNRVQVQWVIGRRLWIEDCGDPSEAGRYLFEGAHPLGAQRELEYGKARYITARMCQARDKALANRVGDR
jgi:hypothetical protein